MDAFMQLNSTLNGIVWGPPMLVLLIGTGVYLTFRTNFFAITKLGYVLKNTLMKMFAKEQLGEGEVTAFQAVATALAATVGTGNIAGVATAIASGGPGALFWMWVAAVVGMTTKFGEVVLAIKYREKTEDGRFVGGPMYYIEKGLKMKWLAVIFAIFAALAAFGIGNMTQSNSIATAIQRSFSIPPIVTGIVVAALSAVVLIGGLKRIAQVTELLVPFMAAFYIIGAIIIIVANIGALPGALALIVKSAFTGQAAIGGFAGATMAKAMRFGFARGVFTNEAGLGSAPIAHAAATTDHPARQGLWGVFEVFIDTLVIATLTGLAIITSGVWESGVSGALLTMDAFDSVIPVIGGYIVSIGILLFAFSTILGWEYYGERAAEYLVGPKVNMAYRLLFVPFVVIGAIGGLEVIWDIADTLNGLMALPNLIGVALLSGVVLSEAKDFFGKQNIKM